MFNFFSKIIFRKPRQASRKIFSYWNGYWNVYADPIEIGNKLELDPFYRADKHPRLAEQDDLKAFQICIDAYRRAFDLPPYNTKTGQGLNATEVIELHATFCLYCEALKKNIRVTRMPTRSMAPTSTESGEPTSSDMLATSSISDGKSIDESISSDLEPSTRS